MMSEEAAVTRSHSNRWICSAAILSFFACAAAMADRKPILEQETLHSVPGSFSQMWQMAGVVAKVRIANSEVRALPSPAGALPRINTIHHATVIRAFKGDVRSGASISFAQVAGQLDVGEAIIRVMDEEPLPKGDYIVFLQTSPKDTQLRLIGDVDGAYKVHDGYIEPQGRFTAFAQQHRGLSERRFVDEIEAVAAKSPKVR